MSPPRALDAPPRRTSPAWLRRAAVASLVVNIAIVVTGGVVRLTGSGLGCPTWPRCTEESFRPHGAMTIHTAIEFGNRMVTFLIAAVAIATLVAVWRSSRRDLRLPAVVLAVGVPAQAALGGVTVLTGLNPWTVSMHLVVSMVMICVAVLLVRSVVVGSPADRAEPLVAADAVVAPTVGTVVERLSVAVFVVGWAVLYLGTVVTGSGPHAGDADAPRNGLDPRSVSQLHTDAVFLLLGLLVAVVVAVRSLDRTLEVVRAARILLVVVLAQGTVGFVQYFTDLPVVLVAIHLLGAALFAAAMTWLLLAARDRTVPSRSAAPSPL
ncbi:heme A synthase [Nocardioides sp. HDW12B]|uniref:COX15/CtaA family protein n=1 Tax=Nocardioides sp. HDW12B TaxID=2714939 RepID=UPI0014092CAF|nr:COX15/CtaA family protein [Nocardioides sp. HDW12B]QIK66345.1 heme A synthase [Nocardioides sp. HDW12B]